jgi:hypothetical protein
MFLCEKVTTIHNNIIVNIKSPIKNLNDNDLINIKIIFNLVLESFSIDEFFNAFMIQKQDTWRVVDVNSVPSMQLNKIVNDSVVSMLKFDGNIDLRDEKGQPSKFIDNISTKINEAIKKYGFGVKSLQ